MHTETERHTRDPGPEIGPEIGPEVGPDRREPVARPLRPDFATFVTARWNGLLRYAYLLTGDHHLAEDVVQTALERCWRRWSSITGAPEAYVRAAIANEAASRRRRKRLPEAAGVHVAGLETLPGAPDPAEGQALRSGLWVALAGLPPRQRAVVVLRVWEDRSETETARILGISNGAVKSQLSKAMAKLRAHPQVRDLKEGPR